jgi:aquaporin Z
MSNSKPKAWLAEFLGTFLLVFAGTAAIVVNDLSAGAITQVGIALVFGLIVAAMIYTFGEISGAHLNPAVTLGFYYARRFSGKHVMPYILSQCLGAISASFLLHLLFPEHASLGATLPHGALAQTFILEILITFMLMLTIIQVATGAKEIGNLAGIAIGGVVACAALFAGPISGASMNPARSIGPALISGNLTVLWLYLLGPTLGSMLAIVSCRGVREKNCCR